MDKIIKKMKENKIICNDSCLLSNNNNIILFSAREKCIYRISPINRIKENLDPCDLRYSHYMSWELSKIMPVLAPIEKKWVEFDNYIISKFPLVKMYTKFNSNYHKLNYFLENLNPFCHEVPNDIIVVLRKLDINKYGLSRIKKSNKSNLYIDFCLSMLRLYNEKYPINEYDLSIIHGDIHSGNLVFKKNKILAIDLDSISVGPNFYDIASWYTRSKIWDYNAHLEAYVRNQNLLEKEEFKSLCGWKIISSLTNIAYQDNDKFNLKVLLKVAEKMKLPYFNELQYKNL